MLSYFNLVRLSATLRTVDCQAPLPMGFSRQEWETGLPFPPPGGLPDPRIKPMSPVTPAMEAGSLPLAPPEKPKSKNAWIEKYFM